jgi:hypothetical protein
VKLDSDSLVWKGEEHGSRLGVVAEVGTGAWGHCSHPDMIGRLAQECGGHYSHVGIGAGIGE